MIDKKFISGFFVKYLEIKEEIGNYENKKKTLEILASILEFSDVQKQSIGLETQQLEEKTKIEKEVTIDKEESNKPPEKQSGWGSSFMSF